MKPIRTWMYAPGNVETRLAKVFTLAADAVIFDWEDAVAFAEKPVARKLTLAFLQKERPFQAFIRVNAMSTPFFQEDMEALLDAPIDGIVLPKSESADDIRVMEHWTECRRQKGLSSIRLVPLIESALGLHNAFAIATASPLVERLAFGSVDYTLDLGATLTKEGRELWYPRSLLVVTSRAAKIEPPIDCVYTDIRNLEGLREDTLFGKQLGFQGRMVVHPNQITIANEVFTPRLDEITAAKRMVEAFDQAEAEGNAVIQIDGKMIDYPVAARAKQTLSIAKQLGLL